MHCERTTEVLICRDPFALDAVRCMTFEPLSDLEGRRRRSIVEARTRSFHSSRHHSRHAQLQRSLALLANAHAVNETNPICLCAKGSARQKDEGNRKGNAGERKGTLRLGFRPFVKGWQLHSMTLYSVRELTVTEHRSAIETCAYAQSGRLWVVTVGAVLDDT